MPSSPVHHIVAAGAHRVPQPFRSFAVRSDEPRHGTDARAPYGSVHVVHTRFLDAATLARLAADGLARVKIEAFSDIEHADTTLAELAAAAQSAADLGHQIGRALRLTGVLGDDPAAYRASVAGRIHYLAACGAGFHNDVARHWSACLFWVLALDLADVEFVLPHAGVRLPLAPGDLLVFDPALAHGLCRPADGGAAVAASFDTGTRRHQVFLTGELPLTDLQWAALGAPWLPLEDHPGALDLRAAQFDERSGSIQRLRSLDHCMQRT